MNPIQFLDLQNKSVFECRSLQDSGYTSPGWYFWDETWAHCQGPYSTEENAQAALRDYCDWLDGKRPC